MSTFELIIMTTEVIALLVFCFFGLHRAQLSLLYWRHRNQPPKREALGTNPRVTPRVLVQLPVFNESNVIERLIDHVCALEYPRSHLLIQVLDDSNDDCRFIAQAKVDQMKAEGYPIEYIHRTARVGFKAGALAAGLKQQPSYEFVAIFDADFIPDPNFLTELLPYFSGPEVGMVQARWSHLNRDHSLLTQTQAVLLDGHFVIEHTARHRSGRFFNFNGTAGMWRRSCIVEAGGWHHETLTEDLDLSYRAQLLGWRFIYLKDVTVFAELPIEITAFKSQQHRWAKGSIQVARKVLPRVLKSDLSIGQKYEASCHLLGNFAYLAMSIFALTHPLLISLRAQYLDKTLWWLDLACLLLASGSVVGFLALGQVERATSWSFKEIKYIPATLGVGIGLTVNNSRAVIEALRGIPSPFVRTPKWGGLEPSSQPKSKRGVHPSILLELGFSLYYSYAIYICILHRRWLALPFILLIWWGLTYVSVLSVKPQESSAGAEGDTL